jgi:hypothetical protein
MKRPVFYSYCQNTKECINISILFWRHFSVLLDHLQPSIQRYVYNILRQLCFDVIFKTLNSKRKTNTTGCPRLKKGNVTFMMHVRETKVRNERIT